MTDRPQFVPAHQPHGVEITAADRLVFVIHGIFGSGRNWRSFARLLASEHPRDAIVTLDLRNHGASKEAEGEHTLAACARDIEALVAHLGRAPDVVIGHSFGGKVAMEYTLSAGHRPRGTWILDCPIGAAAAGEDAPLGSEVGRMVAWLEERAMPIGRRSEITEDLLAAGFPRGVSTWMATNLVANDRGSFDWAFDPSGVRAMLDDYWRRDFYPALEAGEPEEGQLHFVWGTRSDRWLPEDLERLKGFASRASIEVLPLEDAGHWLHVDQPQALLELVSARLDPVS